MKQEEWNEGLNHIDDALVEAYVAKKEVLKKKTIWIRVGAIAASLALVLGIAAVLEANYIPAWEDAQYTAAGIGILLNGGNMLGGTKAYQTVYTQDIEYLNIGSVPKDKYLDVYKLKVAGKAADKTELEGLAKQIVPKLANSLGQTEPQYSIEEHDRDNGKRYSVRLELGDYDFSINQYGGSYSIWLDKDKDDQQIALDGVPVQIDRRLSNEEMIDSIEPIKEKLFEIFGVSFSDVKIWRKDWPGVEDSMGSVYIYFYNEDAHYLNSFVEYPVSDYIEIAFEADATSTGILKASMISYDKNRVDYDNVVTPVKRISLREAEKLLYKGYTFAGHSCPTCVAMNSEVNFKNYDYVGFEYLQVGSSRMPFYTFYKEIYVAPNGVKTYAKTYVAAIEVSGYEEYFESQEDKYH